MPTIKGTDPILPVGNLDRRITIQTATQVKGSAYGEPREVFEDYTTVWAAVVPRSSREFFAAGQPNAEINTKFQIKYIPNLSTTIRVVYRNRTYDVYEIIELGRRSRLNLLAKARRE